MPWSSGRILYGLSHHRHAHRWCAGMTMHRSVHCPILPRCPVALCPAAALLQDPTGCIDAAVHRAVAAEEPDFVVGSTVVLQQVSERSGGSGHSHGALSGSRRGALSWAATASFLTHPHPTHPHMCLYRSLSSPRPALQAASASHQTISSRYAASTTCLGFLS